MLSLRVGVPPIAVDPVRGGAKVTSQARACGSPAVVPGERVPGERVDAGRVDAWLSWCLAHGRGAARQRLAALAQAPDAADELPAALRGGEPARGDEGAGWTHGSCAGQGDRGGNDDART